MGSMSGSIRGFDVSLNKESNTRHSNGFDISGSIRGFDSRFNKVYLFKKFDTDSIREIDTSFNTRRSEGFDIRSNKRVDIRFNKGGRCQVQ